MFPGTFQTLLQLIRSQRMASQSNANSNFEKSPLKSMSMKFPVLTLSFVFTKIAGALGSNAFRIFVTFWVEVKEPFTFLSTFLVSFGKRRGRPKRYLESSRSGLRIL